ncbi:MAG TPA: sulfotransferase, partial [Nitrospira sp.]|nr:sulfotransferase [Nitrospira sp.]
AVWPDTTFIYLYRDVRETLYSMMEAWHSGAFRTYPNLPGWRGMPWSLLLVPGWQDLNGLQLPEVVARQWATTTDTLIDDLQKLEPGRVQAVDYRAFLNSPQTEVERLTKAVGLSWDRQLGEALPLSKTTVSRPDAEKWRRIEPIVQAIWPIVGAADRRARDFLNELGASASDKLAVRA